MRTNRVLLRIGLLASLLGCAPLPLAEAVAPAPRERAVLEVSAAQLHFRDPSGRAHALRLPVDAPSIQLDARSEQAWPSFLDASGIASAGPARPLPTWGSATRAAERALALRLPSLDSPGPGW